MDNLKIGDILGKENNGVKERYIFAGYHGDGLTLLYADQKGENSEKFICDEDFDSDAVPCKYKIVGSISVKDLLK